MKSSTVGGGDSLRPITTTDRHFYSRTETLVFDERGTIQFLVPDLILSTPLKEDDNNTDINILSWPASVERAALVQTARTWTRSADFEPCFVDSDIDTDVRILLEPYRKTAA